MSVFKTDRSPFYHYEFFITWDGVEHRFQGSTKRKSKREAEAVEADVRKREQDKVQLGATLERWTVERAVLGWYAHQGSKLKDARNNKSRIDKLLGAGGLDPAMPLDKLELKLLAQLKDRRIEGGNKPGTVNRELALVQSVLGYAKTRGALVPSLAVRDLKAKEHPKARYFSQEEIDRILTYLDPAGDPRRQDQHDLAILLLDTGARYTEGAELMWLDVDLPRRTLLFPLTKPGKKRTVPISERLAGVLQRRREEARGGATYVFPNDSGDAPRSYAVKGIKRAIREAGCNTNALVKRYGAATVHSLRHTFASHLLKEGVPLHHVSKLLGHATTAITELVYGHIAPQDGFDGALKVLNRKVLAPMTDNVVPMRREA
jgi:integrase